MSRQRGSDTARAPRTERGPRSLASLFGFGLLGLTLFALFLSLGIWQVERRAWKLDLIAAVNERVSAPAIPAPGPATWPDITFETDEYRHVAAEGRFLPAQSAFALASTDLGSGYWLMTPLRTERGFTILVNRGFVPSRDFDPTTGIEEAGAARVTGLLRMSQTGGGFLRDNDPATGRWYSRDVAGIAKAEGIEGPVAPYFIDAAGMSDGGYPVAGLTVVSFRNTHLVYAITWFALAAMVVAGLAILWRHERKLRRGAS